MVAGSGLRGAGADAAGDASFVQDLLSQNTEPLHLLLVHQHLLLPALERSTYAFVCLSITLISGFLSLVLYIGE